MRPINTGTATLASRRTAGCRLATAWTDAPSVARSELLRTVLRATVVDVAVAANSNWARRPNVLVSGHAVGIQVLEAR